MLPAMSELRYLAKLVDVLGVSLEALQFEAEPISVLEFVGRLAQRSDSLKGLLGQRRDWQILVNKSFAEFDLLIRHTDQTAFVASRPG